MSNPNLTLLSVEITQHSVQFSKAESVTFPVSVIFPLHRNHSSVSHHRAVISLTQHWSDAPASTVVWLIDGRQLAAFTILHHITPHPCHHRLHWEFRFGANVEFSCTLIVIASQKMPLFAPLFCFSVFCLRWYMVGIWCCFWIINIVKHVAQVQACMYAVNGGTYAGICGFKLQTQFDRQVLEKKYC